MLQGKKGPVPKPKTFTSNASKGKDPSNSNPSVSSEKVDENPDDALERFPLELRWCLQQLEATMEKKKSNLKEAEDLLKSYKILSGTKAPLIKKRQLMRSLFGDYRKKMADEEKKIKMAPPSLKASDASKKSKCLRQKVKSDNDLTVKVESSETDVIISNENQCSASKETKLVSNPLGFNSESGKTFRFNFSVPD
ncbi:UPF0488 protein CG14286-like [Macrobrachium nipponense]|uniref:UPF0488 protein CG14286-like n=1 Tax=Macrobrachium nipponense TaxID=159736 RepID=UPI0030C80287